MKLTAQTFSVIAGTSKCNATCPYCIRKLTSGYIRDNMVNWRNFQIACKLADRCGINTILITGRGEPTLEPNMLYEYMERIQPWNFPFIELQTNGIMMDSDVFNWVLADWYKYGLTHIAVSVVHYDDAKNKEIFGDNYDVNLVRLIEKLRIYGFIVRLTLVSLKGYIDTEETLNEMVNFCLENKVKQLTIRPVMDLHKNTNQFILSHKPDMHYIDETLRHCGTMLLLLANGSIVYDYKGQNVCLTNSLTMDYDPNKLRQLIFFPDGTIAYDWQYSGAVLL